MPPLLLPRVPQAPRARGMRLLSDLSMLVGLDRGRLRSRWWGKCHLDGVAAKVPGFPRLVAPRHPAFRKSNATDNRVFGIPEELWACLVNSCCMRKAVLAKRKKFRAAAGAQEDGFKAEVYSAR
jgi:hypothetical protein